MTDNFTKVKTVSVKWHDAFSTDAWTDLDALPKEPHECITVGFLVETTKDFITVASTVSQDKQGCCLMHIPRGWIKGLRYLKEAKK